MICFANARSRPTVEAYFTLKLGGASSRHGCRSAQMAGFRLRFTRTASEYCVVLVCALFGLASVPGQAQGQTNYFWNGSGNLNLVGSWGTLSGGGGANPPNFTTANQIFNVASGQTGTIPGAWTISGTGSRLIVQTGGTISTGSINPTYILQLNSGATYNAQASYTNLQSSSTFDPASTFNFAGSGSGQFRDSFAYGNINWNYTVGNETPGSVNAAGSFVLNSGGSREVRVATGSTTARTWTIGQDLTNNAGTVLNLNNGSSSATATLNLSGNFLNNGTIVKSGSANAFFNFVGSGTSTATWGTFTAPSSSVAIAVAAGKTVSFLDNLTTSTSVSLTNSGTLNLGNGGAGGSVTGNITNNGSLRFNRTVDLTYAGVISGTGNVEKLGSNVLTLSTAATHTGKTIVTEGVLSINLATRLGAAPVSFVADHLTMNGGTLRVTGTPAPFSANRGITMAANSTFDVVSGTTATIQGVISGAGTITKTGDGTLELTASNQATSSGKIAVLGGVFSIDSSNALTAAPGSVTPDYLTLDGGAFRYTSVGGVVSLSSNRGVTLGTGGGTFDITDAGANLTNTSVITGAGNLTKVGAGTLTLSGNNNYAGTTNVVSGTLALNRVGGTIPNASALNVSGGVLAVNQSDTVGAVTLSSGTISGAGTLTSNTSFSVTNVSPNTASISAVLAGTAGLSKTGSGTATISSASIYTGSTTVAQGILDVTGSLASPTFTVNSGATLTTASTLNATTGTSTINGTLNGSGSLAVAGTATLAGTGTIGVATTISGTHTPGNSPGLQTFTNDLTYNTGSTFEWELNNNENGLSFRGTNPGFDAVNITGVGSDLTIQSGVNTILKLGSGVDFGASFWATDKQWQVFNVSGGISGLFDNLLITLDTTGSSGSAPLPSAFSWSSSSGSLFLNYTAVPEPASLGGALVLFGSWVGRRRRRV